MRWVSNQFHTQACQGHERALVEVARLGRRVQDTSCSSLWGRSPRLAHLNLNTTIISIATIYMIVIIVMNVMIVIAIVIQLLYLLQVLLRYSPCQTRGKTRRKNGGSRKQPSTPALESSAAPSRA